MMRWRFFPEYSEAADDRSRSSASWHHDTDTAVSSLHSHHCRVQRVPGELSAVYTLIWATLLAVLIVIMLLCFIVHEAVGSVKYVGLVLSQIAKLIQELHKSKNNLVVCFSTIT